MYVQGHLPQGQGKHSKHFFLLSRVREPTAWLCVCNVKTCISLEYVSRADYFLALRVGAAFMMRHRLHDVTETPGSVHGWLSAAVRWTSLELLIGAWWDRQVLGADE